MDTGSILLVWGIISAMSTIFLVCCVGAIQKGPKRVLYGRSPSWRNARDTRDVPSTVCMILISTVKTGVVCMGRWGNNMMSAGDMGMFVVLGLDGVPVSATLKSLLWWECHARFVYSLEVENTFRSQNRTNLIS